MQPLAVRIQRYWLFLFLILIPFSTWYITQTPFAISPINVFSIVFILLGLLNLLVGNIPWTKVGDRQTVLIIAALFLALAYGLLFTHPVRSGIGFWISRLIQPLLVGMTVYQMVAAGYLKVEEFVEALFWSILPLVIGGTLQLLHLLPYLDPGRVSVAYRWPDTFGRYIEILLLLSAPWLFLKERLRPWRVMLWLAGVLIMSASLSYSVVASFVLGLVAVLVVLPPPFQRLRNWTLIGLVVITLLAAIFAPHLPKWEATITASRLTRLEFWTVAVHTIQTHFWTGIGLKGWQLQYFELVQKYGPNHPPINWASQQPQNVFLEAFLKAGLPGFIAITGVLLWPIWRGIQVARQNIQDLGWFGLSAVGYGVGMLTFGLLDDPLWSDDTTPLLFSIFLLLAWVHTSKSLRNSLKLK